MGLTADQKTDGYARKAGVPRLEGTTPKVCGKCGQWFAAVPRQRLCDGCSPAWRRTLRAIGDQPERLVNERVYPSKTHPPITRQTPRSDPAGKPGGAFSYADLCRLWARRTARLVEWRERMGRPVREYPGIRDLTAREVSVAIGWVPWPGSWPQARQEAA